MIKAIVEIILFIALVFILLWFIDPVFTYQILSSVYPLPTTVTTTVTIPATGSISTIYINTTDQSTNYPAIKNNTVIVLTGESNRDSITTYKQVIIYLYITGSFNQITVKNAVLVLDALGSHNTVYLQNTTMLSSSTLGKENQIFNGTNNTAQNAAYNSTSTS